MLRTLAVSLLIGGLALVCRTQAYTATLKGSVARVEITPQIGLPMYGYRSRSSPSQGVLDPLYARVLALEAGETRLAIVTLDLGIMERAFQGIGGRLAPRCEEHRRTGVKRGSHRDPGIVMLLRFAAKENLNDGIDKCRVDGTVHLRLHQCTA